MLSAKLLQSKGLSMYFAVIKSSFFEMTYKNPSRKIPVNVIFCLRFVLRDQTVVCLQVSTMLSEGARETQDSLSGLPTGFNTGIMGWGSTNP